jgi:hypothetical protein
MCFKTNNYIKCIFIKFACSLNHYHFFNLNSWNGNTKRVLVCWGMSSWQSCGWEMPSQQSNNKGLLGCESQSWDERRSSIPYKRIGCMYMLRILTLQLCQAPIYVIN